MELTKSLSIVARKMVLAPSSYEEIFEAAVRRARKSGGTAPLRKKLGFVRRIEIRKIEVANSYVVNRLRKIALTTPFVKELHPFYRELLGIIVDLDSLKRSLSRIYGAASIISKIAKEHILAIKKAKDRTGMVKYRRAYFGRLKSILEDLDEDFKTVRNAQIKILKLPDVKPEIFSVVVAGPPNVGKSSLVRALTRAKPEVREYPFTTKSLTVGHLTIDSTVVQVLDTPGLLDRPLSERNKIELQAILALQHLADLIIFMFDPTETCGFTLKYQIGVLREILDSFKDTPFIFLANKVDIATSKHIEKMNKVAQELPGMDNVLFISAKEGINLDKVKEIIERYVKERGESRSVYTG